MKIPWQSILLAFVLPVVLTVAGVLVFGPTDLTLWGVPVLFLYFFLMFLVASLCMFLSWKLFDSHLDYHLDEVNPAHLSDAQRIALGIDEPVEERHGGTPSTSGGTAMSGGN